MLHLYYVAISLGLVALVFELYGPATLLIGGAWFSAWHSWFLDTPGVLSTGSEVIKFTALWLVISLVASLCVFGRPSPQSRSA